MKKLTTVFIRFAQIELAVGALLILALFVTGNLHMSSIGFIIGFGMIQSSFYTFLIALLMACVLDVQAKAE